MIEQIKNIALYFPSLVVTNEDLLREIPGISSEKVLKNTGVDQRYQSDEKELASDMGVKAAEMLLINAEYDRSQIDYLIFCSECFDYIAPATCCVIQERLKLGEQLGCVDLPYGCSGFIYALAMAKGLLSASIARNILLITSDTPTKTIHKNNIELRGLFSDAATAMLIGERNYSSIGEFVFGTDGAGRKNLYAKNSAFRKEEDESSGGMVMDGLEILNFALKRVPALIKDTLAKNNLEQEEIDLFVFHQPSLIVLNVLRQKLKIPEEKFIVDVQKHGNTVSSSIPIALKEAFFEGRITQNQKILIAGFGVGYSWGATVIST